MTTIILSLGNWEVLPAEHNPKEGAILYSHRDNKVYLNGRRVLDDRLDKAIKMAKESGCPVVNIFFAKLGECSSSFYFYSE